MMKKKRKLSCESAYLLGAVILSLATAMLAAADFGLSMVVAPAYIISLKVPFLTFGRAEYLVQGTLFAILCLVLRKIRPLFLVSFCSGLIYGAILDLWRALLPWLNPEVTEPGDFAMPVRVLIFAVGFFLNSLGVTLYFKSYFYPQVYEFFVKGISEKIGMRLEVFKIIYDVSSLLVAVLISMLLLHRLEGIGVATVLMAFLDGVIVAAMSVWIDRHFEIRARFPAIERKFTV